MSLFSIFAKKKEIEDLAPLFFYFDLIPTTLFKIPILPVPMRINKLISGEPTLIIEPNYSKIYSFMQKLDIYLNYEKYYKIGIKNLINYAKKICDEKEIGTIETKNIDSWFKNSLSIKAKIPSLVEDLDFLLIKFLKFLNERKKSNMNHNSSYDKEISIKYFDKFIEYFNKRLEDNVIEIENENELRQEKIYFLKRKKIFPRIIKLDTYNLENNKKKVMGFVPYLIYDDLIEIFSFNKKIISENENEIIYNYYQNNQKIINYENIEKNKNRSYNYKFYELNNLKIY